LDLYLDSV
jgi:hypothetical protein